ncbi:MAG: cysteine desulfurase [Spirochaetales bacterium]|nr:cysteine desulfurase [Spirochaetales bacterium]MBP5756095.1 cysteine desulfurase [Spirochaetales bacterium]
MYYFDWTATSPISEASLKEYCFVASKYIGNPSSTHPLGLEAKDRLEKERSYTAYVLEVKPNEIFFTSGGTESDSIILSSLLNSPSPGEIITTGIEHSAVLEWKKTLENAGWIFTALNCPGGYLNPDTLKEALNEKVRMVCFMKVNNVTGTVLDTSSLVKTVREYEKKNGRKIHIHCDAVQALGKIPFFPEKEDIDSAAFSAHKFCGPKGIGILYCRNKAITSLSRGGGQEKGLRPGTENLAAICALNKALKDAIEQINVKHDEILGFRRKIEKAALDSGYTLISPSCDSNYEFSPYIINICSKPIPSEVFLRVMSDKGFCLSAGSACSSNSRGKAESVLSAMNIDHSIRMSSIRISMGSSTKIEEVELLCSALETAARELGIIRN